MEGQPVNFLLDTAATFSVLAEAPGPLSSWSTTIMGLSRRVNCYYFSHPLSCNWDSVLFSRVSPSLLLGKDILNKVQASIFINMDPALSLPLIEQNANPRVWADGKTMGQEQNAVPIIVKLNDPHLFSHQKQYSLKPEVNEWAKSYCSDFSWCKWDLKL